MEGSGGRGERASSSGFVLAFLVCTCRDSVPSDVDAGLKMKNVTIDAVLTLVTVLLQ